MISSSLHPEPIRAACRPRGRLAFGLTPRAIWLLAAGLLLAMPGFFHASWGWGMVEWDALVLTAALLDGLRLPAAPRIAVERSWSNAPSLESETEIRLSVEHDGGIVLDCKLVDDLPDALVITPATHSLRAYPRVPAVLSYKIEPRERGDARAGKVYIRYASALGLVERWAVADLEQPVRVYPALRQGEDQEIFLARGRQIELQLRRARERGLGRDFESLREYLEGDDLRDVCWTATARRGQLVTRRYQTERSQPVWIVLDAGRLLRGRIFRGGEINRSAYGQTGVRGVEGRRGYSKLDYACSTATALAQLALYSGDRVGLLVYGQKVQQRVLPGRGHTHLRQIVEALAQARAESSEADHLRATATLNRWQPRRALILWITDLAETAMRPEVVDGAMQLLHRHVLLFVAMAQPDVTAIANARPKNVEEMFRASAAQELTARRELLLARLRDQGALTLDLDPAQLTAAVLNQYLKVKERAMV
ncbi:MAG TPA: DUF58 domain-containing protein [Terracidiphilus sp.]|nr:DUF58 domain-containing protein [Terracidiphilus sp.]